MQLAFEMDPFNADAFQHAAQRLRIDHWDLQLAGTRRAFPRRLSREFTQFVAETHLAELQGRAEIEFDDVHCNGHTDRFHFDDFTVRLLS